MDATISPAAGDIVDSADRATRSGKQNDVVVIRKGAKGKRRLQQVTSLSMRRKVSRWMMAEIAACGVHIPSRIVKKCALIFSTSDYQASRNSQKQRLVQKSENRESRRT